MNSRSSSGCVSPSRLRRGLFLVGGSLALAVGILGVVLPVLPTTPFLIVAAACYARGSLRCYRWLVSNRVFGRYLDDYLNGRGVTWRVKAGVVLFLWGMITVTAVLLAEALWLRILLFAVAAAVTVHIVMLKGIGKDRGAERG
ncbi:MAG: hypothetical protein A2133_09160 [Actinobacteria bacterium RBG_16_64_13]|nr:MAG: hypothetical protein A2133_09160 [Actinobacteria bacterium RBG_16_64_13]